MHCKSYFKQTEYPKKYFAKSLQQNSALSEGVLDTREIFVYVFLSKLVWDGSTIGPEEIHFYCNNLNAFYEFYIATKDVEFETLEALANPSDFAKKFENDDQFSKGILFAYIFSKILCLNDTTNNPDNFGFTKDLKLKIVDFTINDVSINNKDVLMKFLKDDFCLIN